MERAGPAREALAYEHPRGFEIDDDRHCMTSTDTTARVVVTGQHLMAALLGPRDAHLRTVEQRFPDTHVVVGKDGSLGRQ